MAITITHLGHGTYGGGDTTAGSPAVAPAANSLLLLTVRMTGTSNVSDTDAATGFGLTWSRVGVATYGAAARLVVMKAQVGPTAPSPDQVWYTWQRVDNATFPFMLSIEQVTGHDTNAPIRQAVFGSPSVGVATGSLIGANLAAAKDTDSRTLLAVTLLSPVTNLGQVNTGWVDLVTNYTGGTSNERLHVTRHPTAFQTQAYVSNPSGTAYPIYGAMEIIAAPVITAIGPGADTGGFTEASQLNVLGTDTGTLTESAPFPAVTMPVATDAGTFTQTGTVSVALAGSDIGFLDEASYVSSADMLGGDTATVSEAAAVVATLPAGADAGTLTDDAEPPPAALAGTDAAGSAESATLLPMYFHVGSDGGGLTDQASTPLAMLTDGDTGSFVEQGTTEGLDWHDQAGEDTASLTEAGGLVATLPVDLDSGAATEDGAVEDVTYADRDGTDSAALVEDAAVSATLADTDAGYLTDDATVAEWHFLADTDTGSLTDDAALMSLVDGADAGSATEYASLFEAVRILSGADQGRLRDRIVTGRFTVAHDGSTPHTGPGRYVIRPRAGGRVARPDRGEYVDRPMGGLVIQP